MEGSVGVADCQHGDSGGIHQIRILDGGSFEDRASRHHDLAKFNGELLVVHRLAKEKRASNGFSPREM